MTIHETETNDTTSEIKLLPSTTVLKRMLSSGIDEKVICYSLYNWYIPLC